MLSTKRNWKGTSQMGLMKTTYAWCKDFRVKIKKVIGVERKLPDLVEILCHR